MNLEQQKQYLEGYIRELEAENRAKGISEEQVKEIIKRSGEFIRTHNVAECRNFIDSYIERVIVYDDRVDIIFKVNVFDKAPGTVSRMKSEGTKEAVESSYYAKKRSEAGQKTGGKSELQPAVNA